MKLEVRETLCSCACVPLLPYIPGVVVLVADCCHQWVDRRQRFEVLSCCSDGGGVVVDDLPVPAASERADLVVGEGLVVHARFGRPRQPGHSFAGSVVHQARVFALCLCRGPDRLMVELAVWEASGRHEDHAVARGRRRRWRRRWSGRVPRPTPRGLERTGCDRVQDDATVQVQSRVVERGVGMAAVGDRQRSKQPQPLPWHD